ncbi:MAG: hypothetical protein GY742_04220 [Hyphomicrobiales bacterium]|nr:hypothetical protein [Hyphomicrobiales bacterium]
MKQTVKNTLLSKVNAPYGTYASAGVLAVQIQVPSLDSDYIGQVSSFFSEIPVEDQLAFAHQHGISEAALKKAATAFVELSGVDAPLAA